MTLIGSPRRASKWFACTALFALVLMAGLWAGSPWALQKIGRTPSELIDHAERRLQGHPKAEFVLLPVLALLRSHFGEPDRADLVLPFAVPPLEPNPATPDRDALAAGSADDPRVIRVGPDRAITRIAVAAQMAADGSIVLIDPGDYVADVAVWDRKELTIRGTGDRVRLLPSGAHAEGKAIWVIRGGQITIEGIEFVGAKVPDRNGAGIRFERGQLLVRRCVFSGNENGILTSADSTARLEVEDSEFGYNGAGDGATHGIYVGAIGSFRLSGSYVHHSNVGHLVKSRARFNRIEYNRLSDESGGRASYELEFPNGGEAEVVGNIVQQGSGTRNSVMVSYGAEGYRWPVNRLAMVHNTVVNDRRYGGTFVRVAPGAQAAVTRNNLWVGPGRVDLPAEADSAGDRRAEWPAFVQPSREDYRLTEAARANMAGTATVPPALAPRFEYQHPARLRPVPPGPLRPGALQAPPS